MLFGMPTAVTSQGRMRGEVVEYCDTLFSFDDPTLVVSASSGVMNQQGRPFTHGFELHLERATMAFEFAVIGEAGETLMPLTIFESDGSVVRPPLPPGDEITPFAAEVSEVMRAIQTGAGSPVLGGDLAQDAILMCHAQTKSVQRRKPVKV
jgi:predicted dehydrogenase